MSIADGTLVIVGRNLGTVVRARRYGGADGYDISTSGSMYTNFAQEWYVKPAVRGVNVCRKARGQCYCGLVHVHTSELKWLPERAAGADTMQAAA